MTNTGVLQGSVLGPLLCILLINDLLLLQTDLIAYADDTAVPIIGPTWTEIATFMCSKINRIYSRLCQEKLILSMNMSVFVRFGNYRDPVPDNIDITLNGHHLHRVANI